MRPGNATIGWLGAAMLLALSAAQAHAGGAVCAPKLGLVDKFGSDGSECLASSDGTGTPHANAKGAGSFAEADLSSGGKATATAKDGSFSDAAADSGAHSTSHASGAGSFGEAVSDDHGTAKATATAGGNGQSAAFGKCKATGKATGSNTTAFAQCENAGTFATATATNGGTAFGFDDQAPTCIPNGGTATVKSTFGNCP